MIRVAGVSGCIVERQLRAASAVSSSGELITSDSFQRRPSRFFELITKGCVSAETRGASGRDQDSVEIFASKHVGFKTVFEFKEM
jgi:hypothetical protein